jgi:hypothetical protein
MLIITQMNTVEWLRPPGQSDDLKLAKSDSDKRKEMFLEFVLALGLIPSSADPHQLPCYRVERTPEQTFLLSSRCLADAGRACFGGVAHEHVRRNADRKYGSIAVLTPARFQQDPSTTEEAGFPNDHES